MTGSQILLMTAVPNLRNWGTHSAHTHGATRKVCGQVREGFHFTGNPSQFGRSRSVVTWLLLFCSRYGFGAAGPFCAHAQRDVALYLSGAHLDPTRRKFSDGSGENLFFFSLSLSISSLCHDKKFPWLPRTRIEDLRRQQDVDLWTLRDQLNGHFKSRSVTELLMVRALTEFREAVDFLT